MKFLFILFVLVSTVQHFFSLKLCEHAFLKWFYARVPVVGTLFFIHPWQLSHFMPSSSVASVYNILQSLLLLENVAAVRAHASANT